jgi:hypothetical protein
MIRLGSLIIGLLISIFVSSQEINFSTGYLGDNPKSMMRISEILEHDSINVSVCGLSPKDFIIEGFSLTYTMPGIDFKESSNSAKITKSQKQLIETCPGNKTIYFEDIKIRIKDNDSIMRINSFGIRIVSPSTHCIIDMTNNVQITDSWTDYTMDLVLDVDSIVVGYGFVGNETTENMFKVTSFSMAINNSYYRAQNNKFTPEMIKAIKGLKKYKSSNSFPVIIDNVKYIDAYGDEYFASRLDFTIINMNRAKYDRLSKHDNRLDYKLNAKE